VKFCVYGGGADYFLLLQMHYAKIAILSEKATKTLHNIVEKG